MKRIAIATAMALAFSMAAFAADDKAMGTGAGDPEKAETTHQSEVLRESPDSGLAQTDFDRLDENQDGMLDQEELNAYGSTAAGQQDSGEMGGAEMLDSLDMDGDGAISQEEMEQGPVSD